VSIDDVDDDKQLYWKGQKVELYIDNQSENITLTRGTYNVLRGKDVRDFYPTIPPGDQFRTIIKGSGKFSKRLRCYLVYELVLKGQERKPIMKNQRVFIAVEVYSETSSTKCTVSAVAFIVKSSRFACDIDDVDWLHKDLLRHHIVQDWKTFEFDINGRLLEMFVGLVDKTPTRICVRLRSIREYIKYTPVFHRANAFA
jgi:hypothetical protein